MGIDMYKNMPTATIRGVHLAPILQGCFSHPLYSIYINQLPIVAFLVSTPKIPLLDFDLIDFKAQDITYIYMTFANGKTSKIRISPLIEVSLESAT